MGHQICVISSKKSSRDGLLTEDVPDYVRLYELNGLGIVSSSLSTSSDSQKIEGAKNNRSPIGNFLLRLKRSIARKTGQLVDHRLIYALQFMYPWLDKNVQSQLMDADVVMSTSPPWPIHLAGLIVKRRFLTPWVADYRDQFSGSHIQSGSPWFQKQELDLERWLLKSANAVVTISAPMKEYYQQFHPSVFCIENGYEDTLFESTDGNDTHEISVDNSPKEIIIRYLGTITKDRIPMGFFRALVNINAKPGKKIIAEFYGDSSLLVEAIARQVSEVKPYIKICQQLPYVDAIAAMQSADALFFIETSDFSSHSARGVLTTKLFEYLAANKPIIAEISEKALAATYIRRAGMDLVISEEADAIELALNILREGKYCSKRNHSFVQGLSRRLKSVELEKFLLKIVNNSDLRLA